LNDVLAGQVIEAVTLEFPLLLVVTETRLALVQVPSSTATKPIPEELTDCGVLQPARNLTTI
jgi:hypothetical protein